MKNEIKVIDTHENVIVISSGFKRAPVWQRFKWFIKNPKFTIKRKWDTFKRRYHLNIKW